MFSLKNLTRKGLTFQVLTSVMPNLGNAYKYITHTHDITCLQLSTRYTWCENINEEHFAFHMIYRKVSNIRRAKSQNLNASHLIL